MRRKKFEATEKDVHISLADMQTSIEKSVENTNLNEDETREVLKLDLDCVTMKLGNVDDVSRSKGEYPASTSSEVRDLLGHSSRVIRNISIIDLERINKLDVKQKIAEALRKFQGTKKHKSSLKRSKSSDKSDSKLSKKTLTSREVKDLLNKKVKEKSKLQQQEKKNKLNKQIEMSLNIQEHDSKKSACTSNLEEKFLKQVKMSNNEEFRGFNQEEINEILLIKIKLQYVMNRKLMQKANIPFFDLTPYLFDKLQNDYKGRKKKQNAKDATKNLNVIKKKSNLNDSKKTEKRSYRRKIIPTLVKQHIQEKVELTEMEASVDEKSIENASNSTDLMSGIESDNLKTRTVDLKANSDHILENVPITSSDRIENVVTQQSVVEVSQVLSCPQEVQMPTTTTSYSDSQERKVGNTLEEIKESDDLQLPENRSISLSISTNKSKPTMRGIVLLRKEDVIKAKNVSLQSVQEIINRQASRLIGSQVDVGKEVALGMIRKIDPNFTFDKTLLVKKDDQNANVFLKPEIDSVLMDQLSVENTVEQLPQEYSETSDDHTNLEQAIENVEDAVDFLLNSTKTFEYEEIYDSEEDDSSTDLDFDQSDNDNQIEDHLQNSSVIMPKNIKDSKISLSEENTKSFSQSSKPIVIDNKLLSESEKIKFCLVDNKILLPEDITFSQQMKAEGEESSTENSDALQIALQNDFIFSDNGFELKEVPQLDPSLVNNWSSNAMEDPSSGNENILSKTFASEIFGDTSDEKGILKDTSEVFDLFSEKNIKAEETKDVLQSPNILQASSSKENLRENVLPTVVQNKLNSKSNDNIENTKSEFFSKDISNIIKLQQNPFNENIQKTEENEGDNLVKSRRRHTSEITKINNILQKKRTLSVSNIEQPKLVLDLKKRRKVEIPAQSGVETINSQMDFDRNVGRRTPLIDIKVRPLAMPELLEKSQPSEKGKAEESMDELKVFDNKNDSSSNAQMKPSLNDLKTNNDKLLRDSNNTLMVDRQTISVGTQDTYKVTRSGRKVKLTEKFSQLSSQETKKSQENVKSQKEVEEDKVNTNVTYFEISEILSEGGKETFDSIEEHLKSLGEGCELKNNTFEKEISDSLQENTFVIDDHQKKNNKTVRKKPSKRKSSSKKTTKKSKKIGIQLSVNYGSLKENNSREVGEDSIKRKTSEQNITSCNDRGGSLDRTKFFPTNINAESTGVVTQTDTQESNVGKKKGRKRCNMSGSDRKLHPRLLLVTNRSDLNKEPEITIDNRTLEENEVRCGLCKEIVEENNWIKHLSGHYGIGWKEGKDEPINVESFYELSAECIRYFKISGVKSLQCRLCEVDFKSGLGLINHVTSCKLSSEELKEQMIECEHCHKSYRPIPYQGHIRQSCPVLVAMNSQKEASAEGDEGEENKSKSDMTFSNTGRYKRKSVIEAEKKLAEKYLEEKDTEKVYAFPYKPLTGRILFSKFKFKIKNHGNATCLGYGCTFQSSSVNESVEHYATCKKVPRSGFICSTCNFHSYKKKTVVKHHKSTHKVEKDVVSESDTEANVSSEESSNSEGSESSGYNGEDIEGGGGRKRKRKKEKRKRTHDTSKLSLCEDMNKWRKLISYVDLSRLKEFCRKRTIEFQDLNFSKCPLFTFAVPSKATIQNPLISYFPKNLYSMKFSFKMDSEVINSFGCSEMPEKWTQIKRFSEKSIGDEELLFVGGAVTSLAWIPFEDNDVQSQYLAVSCKKDLCTFTKCIDPQPMQTVILIYKIGSGKDLKSAKKAKIVYGIPFDTGPVHQMEFLPSGGYAPELNRLGLMAVSCIKSDIQIYSLPLKAPKNCDIYENNLFLSLKPSIKLKLNIKKESINSKFYEGAQCKLIRWSKAKGHNIITGAYSNGFVAIWYIEEEDNLNKFMIGGIRNFVPVCYFQATVDMITGMDLHYDLNGLRWLILSIRWRDTIIYDIKNLSCPEILMDETQVFALNGTFWPIIWENPIFYGSQESFKNDGLISSLSPMSIQYRSRRLLTISGDIVDVDYNSWENICAIGSNNGDVCVFHAPVLNVNVGKRLTLADRMLLSYSDLIRLDGESMDGIINKEEFDLFDPNYLEKYGIVIGRMTHYHDITKNLNRYAPMWLNKYVKINRVACNNNKEGNQMYAVGYENGLIRIKKF